MHFLANHLKTVLITHFSCIFIAISPVLSYKEIEGFRHLLLGDTPNLPEPEPRIPSGSFCICICEVHNREVFYEVERLPFLKIGSKTLSVAGGIN
jgi:hypothetical protein